ncbi:DUF3040 domain-containing protein [Rarobacter incanus]|uniref:DUF3040 family protein n=1 Tax=Rarobacter incanus TaxID=153494 RepID=A0A542SLI3_9MICO|nr:DUF3040 domain-containing protein [Rarobacter incanus]TQK75486.1 DUF3040 family protein [Rarobacter incanus]
MPLSEHEQRVLEEMERALRGEDAEPAESFDPVPSADRTRGAGRYSVAILGIIVGLVLAVVGVATSLVAVGISGFVVMLAATIYGFGMSPRGADGSQSAKSPRGPETTRTTPARQSFSQKLERRWERRRRGDL